MSEIPGPIESNMPRLFGAALLPKCRSNRKPLNTYRPNHRYWCSLLDSLSIAQSALKQRVFPTPAEVTWLRRTLDETSHEMKRIC